MDLTLLSWNVNGLRAQHRKGFVDWLKECSPDMICLQEIKAQEDQLTKPIKEIEGYYSFFHPAERKGYSGVALYTKLEPISVQKGLGDEKFDTEGRAIIAEYEAPLPDVHVDGRQGCSGQGRGQKGLGVPRIRRGRGGREKAAREEEPAASQAGQEPAEDGQ